MPPKMAEMIPVPVEVPSAPPNGGQKMDEVSQAKPGRPDPEVEAIRATCAALEALDDPSARQRVLAWAQSRFGGGCFVPAPKRS